MLSTQIKNDSLASIASNSISVQYQVLVSNLNDIRLSLIGSELDDDFVNAYAHLCGQVFELNGEICMVPTWLKNQENKKIDALMDKIRMLHGAVECAKTQANHIRRRGKEPARVFEFRKTA
jgi:predicted RNase H-like nuclease